MTVDLLAPGSARPAPRSARPAPGGPSGEAVARLVTAAAAGDQRAWDALVARFGGLLWAVARAHRLNDADAADVVQVTWVRLLEHIGRLQDPARVGAWLATTGRRECLRLLRDHERVSPAGEDMPEPESADPDLDQALLDHERDEALWQSFGRLRSTDQALLRLLVADPRPAYEEIAAALDMPIGSIGPTRQRALERLRHELHRHGSLELMCT